MGPDDDSNDTEPDEDAGIDIHNVDMVFIRKSGGLEEIRTRENKASAAETRGAQETETR